MMDPYAVLGVTRDDSQDDIKKAYRRLAKELHPDLNPGKKDVERRFKELSTAYELIGTKEKREKFDRGEVNEEEFQREYAQGFRGRGGRGRGPFYSSTQGGEGGRYTYSFGGDQGFDFDEDILGSIFGRSRGAGGERGFAIPGEDHHYTMEIDFNDAVVGARRELTLPSGKRLQVRIPPGVSTGSKLRFRGQGGEGTGGARPGDAYLELRVRPSSIFKREGRDISIEVPITLAEAVLGGEVRVPTVDGAVVLKVPPGSDSNTRLRIREKGVVDPRRGTRGDQIVRVRIVLPDVLDPDLKAAVEASAERHPYHPRGGE